MVRCTADSEFQFQPFDFLVDGELIRMPLEQFVLAKGISVEKVLEIEYISAVARRKQEDPCSHDDWVSAVDGSNPGFILTECYDGLARIWKGGAVCPHIFEGQGGAITSASVINHKGVEIESSFFVATASKHRSLKLWKICYLLYRLYLEEEHVEHPLRIRAHKILKEHTSSVQSISSSPFGDMVCSGSWDCSIKLWKLKDSEAEGNTVSIKKRKLHSDAAEHGECQLEGTSITTLVRHAHCVSSVVWPDLQTIYSASWDHAVRQRDVQTGNKTWSMACEKALNCLGVGGESSALAVAGGSDPGTLAPICQFSPHSSWINAICYRLLMMGR